MKAIQITKHGGPEVLTYTDVPDPTPGPRQAVVDLQACGVNYMDVYGRTGLYGSSLPAILGGEGAGTVSAVGPNVTEVKVGDLVAFTGAGATYAERVVVPSWRLIKLPLGLTADDGAAAMLQGMTAHYLVNSAYPLEKGETCLVQAGAGGVGLLLIQMAKMKGAAVITTVSTEEKAKLAKEAGADHVVLYTKQDFAEEAKRITNGKGVDVVYDSVGASTWEKSLASLKVRGWMVSFGNSSGPVQPIAPLVLSPKSLFLTRPTLQNYTLTREELEWRANDVLGWVRDGALKLRIHAKLPLKDAAEAHRQLEGRTTAGKVLLVP
jgi:NADPH2:quinone reductase